jgi:hypothetical protein
VENGMGSTTGRWRGPRGRYGMLARFPHRDCRPLMWFGMELFLDSAT